MTRCAIENKKKGARQRLSYIDNLRILLTVLVVVHHLIVGYGGSESHWYYNEPGTINNSVSWYILTFIWLLNQSFFMGFFFLLSSYFSPGSYDRKGRSIFIQERLRRLGIPILFYAIIANPVLNYIAWVQVDFEGSFWEFWPQDISNHFFSAGILWFVRTLLIFSCCYWLWRQFSQTNRRLVSRSVCPRAKPLLLSNIKILLFCLSLGLLTFVDRIFISTIPTVQFLALSGGHYVQYIALLIIGVVAYRNNWLMQLTNAQGRLWAFVAFGLTLLLPAILIDAGILEGYFAPYAGGYDWGWQPLLVFAMWEQFMCVSVIVALLVWFREKFNYSNKLTKTMAASTYTVYLIHAPIITFLIFAFRTIQLPPALKCALVTPVAVVLCFAIAYTIRQIPFAKTVL